jgi:hypothetical protein
VVAEIAARGVTITEAPLVVAFVETNVTGVAESLPTVVPLYA